MISITDTEVNFYQLCSTLTCLSCLDSLKCDSCRPDSTKGEYTVSNFCYYVDIAKIEKGNLKFSNEIFIEKLIVECVENYVEAKCQNSGVTKVTFGKLPLSVSEKQNRWIKFGVTFNNFDDVSGLLRQNDFSKIFKISVKQETTTADSTSTARMRILKTRERKRRKFHKIFFPYEKKYKIIFDPVDLRKLQTTSTTQQPYTIYYERSTESTAAIKIQFSAELGKTNMSLKVDQPYLQYNEEQFPISKIEQNEEVEVVSFLFYF